VEVCAVEHSTFNNFGELYRAAFAEQDPERKLFLLSQVRKALDYWEEQSAQSVVPDKPKPRCVVATFPPSTGFGKEQIA
jgi:hypothetical protein